MKFIYRFFSTIFKFSAINISQLRTFGGEGSKNIGFEVNTNVIGYFKNVTECKLWISAWIWADRTMLLF